MKFWSQLLLILCCLMTWSSSVFSFDEEPKDRISSAVKSAPLSLDLDNTSSDKPHQAASTLSSANSEKEAFDILPPEIWGRIAHFIPGDELPNYLLTCHSIYDVCITDPILIAPPRLSQLFRIIGSSNFQKLQTLANTWSRSKKKTTIQEIQKISTAFSDHTYTYPYEIARNVTELEYTIKMRNFTVDAKCKFLLYHLGDPSIEKTLTDFKGDKLCQYLDCVEGIENYPYALRWQHLQAILCHPHGFQNLYRENEEDTPLNLKEERIEALKYKTSFSLFTQLMSLFTSEIEKMTNIF